MAVIERFKLCFPAFRNEKEAEVRLQMQSHLQQEIGLPIDHNYSSSEISLLGSRHRLKCEASESQSQVQPDTEQEMQEFKQEIEGRYRLSIPNKIYTFPRSIRSVVDLCSSSEDETTDHCEPKDTDSSRQPVDLTDFKKKTILNAPLQRAIHNGSTLRHQYESQRKGPEMSKRKESAKKREKRSKGKPVNRESAGIKGARTGQGGKKERQRTEGEYPSSYLETIRAKMGKKN